MDELTRRRLLGGVSGILGATAGCQSLGGAAEDTSQTGPQDGVPGGEIYVRASPSELPDAPSSPSFGVTGTGVYEFREQGDGWRHVRHGSPDRRVPRIDAAEAAVGASPTSRPLISNGDRTVYVDPNGGDDTAAGTRSDPLATIQQAVSRVPIYLRHQYTIDLATVPETPVAYDEDVLVPAVVGTGMAGREEEAAGPGPFLNLVIRGEPGNPSAVDVGSIMFGNVLGTAAGNLYHVRISRDSPYDDEGYGLSAYGDGELKLYDIRFTDGPTNGVLIYGARTKASLVDFGEDNVAIGLKAKRHASVIMHQSQGVLESDAFRATGNSLISVVRNSQVTGNPMYNTLRGGLIFDDELDSWVGLAGNANVTSGEADQQTDSPADNSTEGSGNRSVDVYRDHPDDKSIGDIWYVDGSGEASEGFYGQVEDGPVKIG